MRKTSATGWFFAGALLLAGFATYEGGAAVMINALLAGAVVAELRCLRREMEKPL